jgi:hypothetical protein
MALKSALEDLTENTLALIAGMVGKIDYVSRLRDAPGRSYSHWGLSNTYGEPAVQQAVAEVHQLLFLRLLRTPLRTLREDVAVSSAAAGMSGREYVEKLRGREQALLPEDLGGGSRRHFSSVLHVLSILASVPATTPPGATPQV